MMSDDERLSGHEQYVMDQAERALLSNAEAYRLVEEAVQLRAALAASEARCAALVAEVAELEVLVARLANAVVENGDWRFFHYNPDPIPEGVFDLRDRFSPGLAERWQLVLDSRPAPGEHDAP